MSRPEFDDFRKGDEAPDAHLDGFNVFAGNPTDRKALQESDPDLIDKVSSDLDSLVKQYEQEMGLGLDD